MVLRNEHKKPKRNSNNRTPPTTPALQNTAESTNDNSSLDGSYINQSTGTTMLASSSCTTEKSQKTHSNFKKQLNEKALLNKQYLNVNTLNPRPYEQYVPQRSINKQFSDSTSIGSDYSHPFSKRLSGGTVGRQQRDNLILSPSQCKLKPAGLEYLDPKNKVNVLSLQLNVDELKGSDEDLVRPKPQKIHRIKKNKTRATQTLFRESSAQTLPYLPGVSNNREELENLEIFKLPSILPGDGPPGIYEVEVLERARRRWAFANALKENLRKQFEAAKELARLQDHQHIIEAFEWEHWIEREEYIQECQMLRLELLIRMFDKREREMHEASKNRIQKSCEIIEAEKKASLKKNELEHNRALRRLERSHSKQPRVWRKEHITQELGDPSSEFYAPQMRYGVNPSRRHFTATHKGFDIRMDELEKKAIKMDPKNLKCPFAKLREWSKPKEVLQEVEQNFCSDSNLKKLYESLRALRETSRVQKYIPACLKAKQPPKVVAERVSTVSQKSLLDNKKAVESLIPSNAAADDSTSLDRAESFKELRQQKQIERVNREIVQQEMRFEELETLICSYEGNTIGWLMRFLTEEMSRLTEKRKLHFFTMMAKRTRWHREAAEAGLRQKENCVRETYEKLYKDCNKANKEVTDKFLDSILCADVKDYAHQMAEQDIVAKAKEIDKEIAGWLESFKEVQNPMNYQTLRHGLKDIIIPDVEKIIYRLERDRCIDFIINDVLLFKVYSDLEPYDIILAITNDFVDRLIDNDLYLNSPDCSSDCECLIFECAVVCCCSDAKKEARAIVRKLIRHAVSGKRWRTEEERICDENVFDLLNEIFDKVIKFNYIDVDITDSDRIRDQGAHTDLVCSINDIILQQRDDEPVAYHEHPDNVKLEIFDSECKSKIVDVTKSLRFNEQLLLLDPDCVPTTNEVLIAENKYTEPSPKPVLSKVRIIPSTHNLSNVFEFCDTPVFALNSSEELSTDEQIVPDLNYEMINETMDELSIEFEERNEEFQLEIEEEQAEEEQPEHEQEEKLEHAQEQEQRDEEQQEKEKVKEEMRGAQKTVRVNEGPSEIINNYKPSTIDEDNELMKVSFTYDPNVKYSIPKPSDYDSNADVDNDDDDDNDDKISKSIALNK